MAETTQIKASARARSGKGAARAVRREGRVPGVIYGDKREPETVALDANELWKVIQKGKFLSTVIELDVEGKTSRVLPRDVQLDPVRDTPVHIDFQRVTSASRVRVGVPVRFINELASPGLKRGGVLNIVRHHVEVTCPAERIPEEFVFDLTGLEIGRSIHISAITLPEGVKPTIIGRDFTVATIAGASAKAEEDAAAAAAAAGAGAEVAPGAEGAAPAAGAPAGDAKAAAAPAKPGDAKAAAAPAAKGAPVDKKK